VPDKPHNVKTITAADHLALIGYEIRLLDFEICTILASWLSLGGMAESIQDPREIEKKDIRYYPGLIQTIETRM
jgi:hypothetical protein